MCSTLNGNTSDTRGNQNHLAQVAALLPKEDDVTIVADCKLVDGQTIGQVLSAGFHFISLLPEPDVDGWPVLGSHPGRRKADPTTYYRGWSVERPFPVLLHKAPSASAPGPLPAVQSVETMRFLVVHSDALAALFDGQLEGRLDAGRAAVVKALEKVNNKPASCEKDAVKIAQKALPTLRFHRAQMEVREEVRPVKRAGRGRPLKDAVPPTETMWIIDAAVALDADAVAAERRHASCFPFITDHTNRPGWEDARILAEYRHQGVVEGNTGFRWFKGPAAVAPMFPKTPTPMRALGLVTVLALMVRNVWQYRMRGAAREAGEKIIHPFTPRPAANLTAEMAMEHFGAMHAVRLRRDDGRWKWIPRELKVIGKQILAYLRVPEHVFWTPPSRKIVVRTI